MMYTNFQNALRQFQFTITLKKQQKIIKGVVNAQNDEVAKNYIGEFGFNDKNSIIAISMPV